MNIIERKLEGKSPGEKTVLSAKLDWMKGSSYGARERESIMFFIKIFATMCCKPLATVHCDRFAIFTNKWIKKVPVVCRCCASCSSVAKSLRDQGICGRLSKWCINIVPYGVVGSDSPLKMEIVCGVDLGNAELWVNALTHGPGDQITFPNRRRKNICRLTGGFKELSLSLPLSLSLSNHTLGQS